MPPTTLTRDRLRALADTRADGGKVLSVFLNLDPANFATPPARATAITSVTTELEHRVAECDLPGEVKRRLQEDAQRVREALKAPDIADGGVQGVAVFVNGDADLFEIVGLPHPIESRVVIDSTAYVEPLVAVGAQERWLVLLANRAKARFFVGAADGLEETDQLEEDVHRRHSQGGWSQARFERSVEQEVTDHLKNTADLAFQIFKRRPFDHALIGAPDETVGALEQHLHPYLRERIAGRLHIDVGASSLTEVNEAARAAIDTWQGERERTVIERVAEQVGRGERGASGLGPVLDALNQARVEILVVQDAYTAPGVRDPETDMLAPVNGSTPSGHTEPLENVIEEAMQKAVETNAEVLVVRRHREALDEHGGIAALLRY